MTNTDQPTTSTKQTITRPSALWQRLVAPPDAVTDIAQRRGVQLLASLLLFFIPLSVMGIFSVISQSNVQVSLAQWLNLVAFLISYILSRTRYYKVSVVVLLMVLVSSPFLAIINNPARYDGHYELILVWLVIPFLLASALLSLREMSHFIGLTSMGFILLPLMLAELTFSDMLSSFGILATTAVLIIVVMHHRNQIENDRQAELRESEERFRRLVEQAADAIFVIAPEGILVGVNQQACDSLGYSRQELLNLSLIDIAPTIDSKLLADIRKELALGVPLTYESVYQRQDGSIFPVEFRLGLLESGRPSPILALARDITERKQVQEALHKSEERYRILYNNLPIMMHSIDQNGGLVSVNYFWLEVLGYKKDEVIGRKAYEFLTPASRRYAKEVAIPAFLKSGIIKDVPYKFVKKNTEVIDVLLSASAYQDPMGEFTDSLAVIRDITERKRASEQLKASLKEKEVLLKEIHHRVKNNLQIISSLLYLQSENIEEKATRQMFKESQNRVKSMALIHEQLYQTDNLAKIDLVEYIERLTNHLSRSWRANHISLQLKIEPLFLTIETAIPCGLIINELLTNAMKYAFPEGEGGQIWVQMQAGEDHQLTLSVKDNGVGFPKEINFRRPRSLGLTLVTTLVKQLKGTIELLSSDGTEFNIRFSDASSRRGQ